MNEALRALVTFQIVCIWVEFIPLLKGGNARGKHECEIAGERHSSVNGIDDGDDDRRHSGVKSTAIVKYASTEMPAQYHELQPNTDLNTPPSNWLYGNSKWESYIQNVSLGQEHSFSR